MEPFSLSMVAVVVLSAAAGAVISSLWKKPQEAKTEAQPKGVIDDEKENAINKLIK